VAGEQLDPVEHPGDEVAERAADDPEGEAGAHSHDAIVARPMAAVPVTTTVTELGDSRVRVEAEVAPAEVDKRVAVAAKALGRNLRIPGFRQGKVPPQVIVQRVGREAVLDEAVRESLPRWYGAAITGAGIVPVGDPSLDLSELPGEGQPLRFTIEIGVRPTAELGEYKGLEVGRREPDVSDEAIDAEVEQLRERSGRLETVERAAADGDFVVMDYLGTIDGEPFAGGEGRDQMVELGSGRLVGDFEAQLQGAGAGDERTVTITFPDDYGAGAHGPSGPGSELAGKAAEFAVTVKEVKEKQLPEVDDELAAEAGFDTLDELRADIRERLAEAETQRIDAEYREAVLDAVVDKATVTVPAELAEGRSRELWEQMAHTLAHQGIDKATYLRISGKEEDAIVEEGREDAERQLKRDAVLAAIIEAETIEISDDEVLEAVDSTARQEGVPPKKLLDRLRSSDRLDGLKADLAARKALDLIVESAKPIDAGRAAAREQLWTPGS
jgi:trigger factor